MFENRSERRIGTDGMLVNEEGNPIVVEENDEIFGEVLLPDGRVLPLDQDEEGVIYFPKEAVEEALMESDPAE